MRTRMARGVSAFAAACVAVPALAQNPSGGSNTQQASGRDGVEEVVVTAQRRVERLQDVPISISVMSGIDLDSSTSGGIVAALNQVPGAVASVFNQYGSAFVTLRGVSAGGVVGNAGGSTVGYYLDSSPFGLVGPGGAISPDANAYDLSRVEVLRGPQGTLYGVNSFSGVVRVLTNDANLDRFEAKGRLSSSNTEDGDWNYRGDAAINVPIVEGKLAMRAVAGYEDVSGWVERTNEENVNDGELRNWRVKLGARPIDQLTMSLSAWQSDTDYDGIPASTDAGTRDVAVDEPLALDSSLYSFTAGYQFPSFSISSNTSNLEYDVDSLKRSIFSASFLRTILNASIFSQEFNLNSTAEGAFRWSAGAVYRDGDEQYLGKTGPLANHPVLPLNLHNTVTSESWAVFGEVTYNFVDTLDLTLGLRYFEDEHTQVNHLAQNATSRASFQATTPRVTLTWHPSRHLTTYTSYSQGFRSGMIRNPFAAAAGFGDVKPDRLNNYELGAKGDLFGGRMTFDTALYYMKWEDMQQSLTVPVGQSFAGVGVNATSASGPGFEIATTFRPIDALNIGLNFSWNDVTFDETVLSGGQVLFEKGARINSAAEYTYGGSLDYALQLGSSEYEARLSASANYHSELISRGLLGTIVVVPGDSILVGRASLAIGPKGNRWGVTLFADNVTNERGATMAKWPPPGRIDEGTRLRPRTFGAQLEYNF